MGLNRAGIQAVCFDVDGTLSDTDDVWNDQLGHALRPLARLVRGIDTHHIARRLILAAENPGNLAYTLLDRLGFDDEVGRLFNYIARRGSRKKKRSFRLIPGVDKLLPALAGRYPLAVISARGEPTTLTFLEQFNLRQYFVSVATALTCEHTKPFPDPLLWTAARLGVPPSACLMVGDTTVDIRMARAAGAQSVGVLCGFGEQGELRRAGADEIVEGTAELLHLV
jgi:HAD superfamily hydrolase (TIGR01509 family)